MPLYTGISQDGTVSIEAKELRVEVPSQAVGTGPNTPNTSLK